MKWLLDLRLAGASVNSVELGSRNSAVLKSLSKPTSKIHDDTTCTSDSSRIGAFGFGGNHDDIAEDELQLIEAQLVEQEIPHAVVHAVDDKDELYRQLQQRDDYIKRGRHQRGFLISLAVIVVGAGLAIGLSRENSPTQVPPTAAPTSKAVMATPGSRASDVTCDLSIECARRCCSNLYIRPAMAYPSAFQLNSRIQLLALRAIHLQYQGMLLLSL